MLLINYSGTGLFHLLSAEEWTAIESVSKVLQKKTSVLNG